jgi:hypothetical protein
VSGKYSWMLNVLRGIASLVVPVAACSFLRLELRRVSMPWSVNSK